MLLSVTLNPVPHIFLLPASHLECVYMVALRVKMRIHGLMRLASLVSSSLTNKQVTLPADLLSPLHVALGI